MKLAIICDLHLSNNPTSPQANFLSAAAKQMRKDGIQTILSLGDISACGEWEARDFYLSVLKDFKLYTLLGNSDIRNPHTLNRWISSSVPCRLSFSGRTLLGIHTPDGSISKEDRKQIEALNNGDILALHHGIRALDKDSRNFLTALSQKRSLTILNGHHHRFIDEYLGNFRMITFRALDPDKAIGNYPSITYLEITKETISLEEKFIELPLSSIHDASKYFGISCVDNLRDVTYATENNIYAVELRCNGGDWKPDTTLLPLLKNWKTRTNGYLSVHMPNVHWKNGQITGLTQWKQATAYALAVGVNGLTIHPPRVCRKDMFPGSTAWNAFLELYTHTVAQTPDTVSIGIENLHLSPTEKNDPTCKFGCTPQEVSAWIDAINEASVLQSRVGHTLDVGHARNNGTIAQQYPISRWYEIMGNRTVAYHIHQVVNGETEMHNHQPIEGWFGPMISYVSFFHCWDNGTLNHKPIFLEVQGRDNFKKSMDAFHHTFDE